MLIALVATVLAILVAQLLPAAQWRQRLLAWWPRWLAASAGQSAWGWLASLALPMLLLGLLQWLTRDWLYGTVAVLLGVAVLVLSWGPRDLERDVEALVYADDGPTREQARQALYSDGLDEDPIAPPLAQAVAVALLRRALGVLFWFLVLGPVGAFGYRLLASQAIAGQPLSAAARERLRGVLAVVEWPVAQLAVLSFALMGNLNGVLAAWQAQGRWRALEVEPLLGAAMAGGLPEARGGDVGELEGAEAVPLWERAPVLREAMHLSWRTVGLWCGLMAFWVLASWLG